MIELYATLSTGWPRIDCTVNPWSSSAHRFAIFARKAKLHRRYMACTRIDQCVLSFHVIIVISTRYFPVGGGLRSMIFRWPYYWSTLHNSKHDTVKLSKPSSIHELSSDEEKESHFPHPFSSFISQKSCYTCDLVKCWEGAQAHSILVIIFVHLALSLRGLPAS